MKKSNESATFPPPRPLNSAALAVWDRHAARIWREGRWAAADQELLAVFAETIALYLQFREDVDRDGTLVQGRSLQERVRHPSLMGLSQCRADLVRLARQIPLMPPAAAPADAGADVDAFLAEVLE